MTRQWFFEVQNSADADKLAEDKLRAEPRAVFRADGCAEKMAQMRKRRSNFFYVLR
jgi:hypothetical protein